MIINAGLERCVDAMIMTVSLLGWLLVLLEGFPD
jgi:hypothetical protein